MSYKNYSEAGFNLNVLFSASIRSSQIEELSNFEKYNLEDKTSFIESKDSPLPELLSKMDLSPFSNPVEGIDYIIKDRESWMSPLTLLVDLILINKLILSFDNVKNLSKELQNALLIKSKIKITLQVNDPSYYIGFNFLFSHSPLRKEILESFNRNVIDNESVLLSDNKRMSADTINSILNDNHVKTELRKIAFLFKEHSSSIGKSLSSLSEYICVPAP